jgi:hypothetical protein
MKWRSKSADRKRSDLAYATCCREWHKEYALFPRLIEERIAGGILVPAHRVWLEQVACRWRDGWEYKPYNDEPTLQELMDKNIQEQIEAKVRYEEEINKVTGVASNSSAYFILPSNMPPGQLIHLPCDQSPSHIHTVMFT